MAERPSVKEILAMARQGGAAKPADAATPPPAEEPAAVEESVAAPEPAAAAPEPAPAADVPTPATLGRPLTLKEKLAAARAGGAPPPAAAKAPATPPPAAAPEPAAVEEAPAAAPAPAADVPTPATLGRPLTLKEKLAAARAGGGTAPAPAPTAGAKLAAAKPAAGAAPAKATAARTLPPLEKMSDPRDLAEALRQTGAKKAKEVAAKTAAAAPAKPAPAAKAGHKEAKPQTVPPKPSKKSATAAAAQAERRGFMIGSLFISFIVMGWTAFVAANVAFAAMLGRFMFPNVLAEPPSTIKIGLPTNYEKEEVNERFKAEWGFWVVRSIRYDGQDILYALQSVCTHLGCPPNWLGGEQKFKCPCHGSGFYISGINFEGPAPRPLERFKVAIADDGQVMVDKSQKFQQELGQWSDPDSFIAV
jgi:cytochrome b6-f complex iron-sulfur subunit